MDKLSTPENTPLLIDEQVKSSKLELVEGVGEKKGRVFARGEFGHAAKPTANKRFYRHAIWEGNISRLRPRLEDRKVLGELDHPTDGRTALQRASHVITDLRLEGDRVWGEAEILDTAKGRDLKAILAAQVPVGISSRGFGSTKPGQDGVEEVQEDYRLVTFDFVAEPADDTAYPEVVFEGKQQTAVPMLFEGAEFESREVLVGGGESDTTESPSKENSDIPNDTSGGLTPPVVEELRQEFSEELLSRVEAMRDSVEKKVREEMLTDPSIAGARHALNQIWAVLQPYTVSESEGSIVSERDAEIQRLRTKLEEMESQVARQDSLIETLTEAAREAGYKYYLECLLHDETSESSRIREIVGDVSQYESADALRESVEDAVKEMQTIRLAEEQESLIRDERVRQLQEQNQQLATVLEESLRAQKQLSLQVYAAQRLQTHPSGAKIQRVLSQSGISSTGQIDALIEEFREPSRDPDDLADVRARIRERLMGGREHSEVEMQEKRRDVGDVSNADVTGMSLTEYRHLAGLK